MKEQEFKEKLIDVLELYFDKESIQNDVLNHVTTLAEKFAREKCDDYKSNIIDYISKEWDIEKDNLIESISHGIKRAPLPEFNWLQKIY